MAHIHEKAIVFLKTNANPDYDDEHFVQEEGSNTIAGGCNKVMVKSIEEEGN